MLGKHLDKFIIVYLNNIIIYSKIEKEHYKYIKWVLQRLVKKRMLVAIKKYKFYITKTEFCGFIIKLKKLNINPKKIKAILKWQRPSNITELQLFLGFCNYYKRFIKY